MLQALELIASCDPVVGSQHYDAATAGVNMTVSIKRVKNRFKQPTPGGWADCLVLLTLAGSEQVVEIQLVHTQMMLVRQRMQAHEA
jgi:hypothetical protein